jgi:hypothetical protein
MLQTVSWPREVPAFENPGIMEQRSYDGGYAVENAAHEQIVDLLSMNWISPEYSHGLDWNGMFPAENPTQIDTSKPPFSFLFQPPAAMGGVGDSVGTVDGQAAPPSQAHATYAAEVEHNTPTFHRRFSACGPSTNGSARTGSDAPTSYVDGGEARAPFPGRALHQHQGTKDHITSPQAPLPVQENETTSQTGTGFILVTDSAYNNMVQNIHREAAQQLLNVDTTRFPSHQRIEELARLYFTNFHSTFPFIRRTDFPRKSAKHWILLLAVAAIGTKYAQTNTPESFSDNVLLTILDTILNAHIQSTEADLDGGAWNVMLDEPETSHLPTLQALILNIIWKVHSSKKPLVKRALAERYYLVTECTRIGLLSSAIDETSPSVTDEVGVLAWLRKESGLRTGMMIWVSAANILAP